jgi:hypothetical protein
MAVPSVRARTTNLTIASWSNVCITFVKDELTASDVQRARLVYESFAADIKGGFVSVIVVAENVGLPSDEARKAIPDLMRGVESQVLAMIGVLEASGFKAAAVRSAMAVMSMVSRTNYPRKIAANVREAAPWIAEHVRPVATADVVESAIQQVKQMS